MRSRTDWPAGAPTLGADRARPTGPREDVRGSTLGIDSHEAGVDDPALLSAVEGVAGGEDEGVEAPVPDDAPVLVVDDLVLEHLIAKRGVRERQRDPVPVAERVDAPERGTEGRPVAGDRHRPAHPGKRGRGIVPWPAREVGPPPRSLDEDGVQPEPRDLDAAERLAQLELPMQPVGRCSDGEAREIDPPLAPGNVRGLRVSQLESL